MRARRILAVLLVCAACGFEDGHWDTTGVVREVRAEDASLLIEHGDIPDLMPAMTMSFDVADPSLLEGLEPGQYVEFRLRRTEQSFEIVSLHAPGGSSSGQGGGVSAPADPLLGAADLAPPFRLIDQLGEPFELETLRGSPVVLDFIFTRCAGPCPILTGLLADARRALSPEQRARVRFVSITLDPAYDTPERLRDYARTRRVDTEGWSFLTGPVSDVDAVVRAYGVGNIPATDGSEQLAHTLVTFLIDAQGHVKQRLLGLNHSPQELRERIAALL